MYPQAIAYLEKAMTMTGGAPPLPRCWHTRGRWRENTNAATRLFQE